MHSFPLSTPHRQRGAAALIVTMLLFFAMALMALFVSRNTVLEQRMSANQYRSTQAFEAAEAGQEWALALLNHNGRIGADCLPSGAAAATSFRERYLAFQRIDATFAPTTWNNAGVAMPLQPTCVHGAAGWSCSCPAQGLPAVTAPAGNGAFPAFMLQFLPAGKPGLVRVVSTGCTSLGGSCSPGSTAAADATARIDVTLGLLSGLRTPPAAALTARGSVDAGTASLGIHNADPATGLGVLAGGAITAHAARLTPPAGTPAAGMLVGGDARLAGLAPEAFFASFFGMAKAAWRSQPVVTQLACNGECTSTLVGAAGASALNPLIWVQGDTVISGPVVLGSPNRPVVVVVDGSVALSGAVVVYGVVYANGIVWDGIAAPGALLRGALVSEGDYAGHAAADLSCDASVLAALNGNSGSFARVSGSWRDF